MWVFQTISGTLLDGASYLILWGGQIVHVHTFDTVPIETVWSIRDLQNTYKLMIWCTSRTILWSDYEFITLARKILVISFSFIFQFIPAAVFSVSSRSKKSFPLTLTYILRICLWWALRFTSTNYDMCQKFNLKLTFWCWLLWKLLISSVTTW